MQCSSHQFALIQWFWWQKQDKYSPTDLDCFYEQFMYLYICIRRTEVAEFLKSKCGILWLKTVKNPHVYSLSLLFERYLCLPHAPKGTGPDSSGLWQLIVSGEKQFHQSCFVALFLKCLMEFGKCLGAFVKERHFEDWFFWAFQFLVWI